MTVNRIAYLAMAVTGLLYASGLGFAQTATTTPPHVPLQKAIGQAKDAKPEVVPSLIVLNARGATLQGQKLTLVGVAQNSIVFAEGMSSLRTCWRNGGLGATVLLKTLPMPPCRYSARTVQPSAMPSSC